MAVTRSVKKCPVRTRLFCRAVEMVADRVRTVDSAVGVVEVVEVLLDPHLQIQLPRKESLPTVQVMLLRENNARCSKFWRQSVFLVV